MSGLEVAGIVLGALPLIIYAFEHLRDGASRLGRLINFNAEFHRLWGEVEDEELMYRLQLKILLKPLVNNGIVAEDELEELMLSPDHELWRDADVDGALSKRLGESYDRYVANLTDIQALTWQIIQPLLQSPVLKERLGGNEVGYLFFRVAWPKLTAYQTQCTKQQLMARAYTHLSDKYKYEHDRIKFALGRRLREEILDSIRRKIKLLGRILAESDQIAAFEQSNKVALSSRSVKNLVGYWRHADRVFSLLLLSWVCPCKQNHCAHLWLQHRTTPRFDFRMLVLFAPKGCNTAATPPWQQHGIQIEWTSSADNVANRIIATAAFPSPRIPMQPSRIVGRNDTIGSLARKGKGKTVKACARYECNRLSCLNIKGLLKPFIISFGLTPRRSKVVSFVSRSDTTAVIKPADNARKSKKPKPNLPVPSLSPSHPPTSQNIIKNLCHTMEQCGMQSADLGLLVDKAQGEHYRVFSQPEQKIAADEISLSEILHSNHKPRLQRVQRLQIALKIASSHLQLHSTAWARRQWEATDVRFPQTSTDPADIHLHRPFVSANFEAKSPSHAPKAPRASDRSFACLGIMLLELGFGTRLEDHELWQQLGAQNSCIAVFRLMVAKQWVDDMEGEAGPEYASAVMWCLNKSPATLEGDEWRTDLASEVVLPLQNCCEWISPKTEVM